MLFRFFFITLFVSHAVAEHQLSLYGLGSAHDLQQPGVGAELSSTVGNRAVLGAAFELSEAQPTFDRELRARLDLRLLFGAEQATHWYPTASAQWRLSKLEIEPWLGAGIEHELIPQAGLFSDLLWQPFEAQLQARIGLRIWLSRFNTLDARVNSARPLGAVYRPQHSRPNSQNTNGPVVFTAAPKSEPLDVTTRASVEVQPVSNNDTAVSPEQWHVQLGFFSQRTSATKLQADARLDRYGDSVFTWYDSDLNGYRLLIGPMSQVRARSIRQELIGSGLESLLYQRPVNE